MNPFHLNGLSNFLYFSLLSVKHEGLTLFCYLFLTADLLLENGEFYLSY